MADPEINAFGRRFLLVWQKHKEAEENVQNTGGSFGLAPDLDDEDDFEDLEGFGFRG